MRHRERKTGAKESDRESQVRDTRIHQKGNFFSLRFFFQALFDIDSLRVTGMWRERERERDGE